MYGSEFSNQAGEFPLQHYASEFSLTYKGKFPILHSSKSAFLSKKIKHEGHYQQAVESYIRKCNTFRNRLISNCGSDNCIPQIGNLVTIFILLDK